MSGALGADGPPTSSSQYSPISTLERQYAPPAGSRITILVRANPGCLVEGGVEAVLRAGGQGRGAASPSPSEAARQQLAMAQVQQVQQQGPPAAVDLLGFDGLSVSGAGSAPPSAPGSGNAASLASSAHSAASSSSSQHQHQHQQGRKGLGGLGSRLVRVAKGAQNQLERGVTTMAIRVDRGRARPDLIAVGAYVRPPGGGGEEVCVGMTEDGTLPEEREGAGGADGTGFAVPIVLSPSLLGGEGGGPAAWPAADLPVTFRLFLKSGAAMLAGKGRRYAVGTGATSLSYLRSLAAEAAGAAPAAGAPPPVYATGRCAIPLAGPALVPGGAGAALELLVGGDAKFPPLCGIAWTLGDPRADTAYLGPLYSLPLDAPLCFPMPAAMGVPGGILLGTERATESTVVLPIAAACAAIFSEGAARSTAHAADVARALRDRALRFGDPMSAVEAGHAQCQLDVAYVLLGTPGTATEGTGGVGAGARSSTVVASLQRPDTIFETELGSSSIPVYRYDPNFSYSTASALSVPFYPRICRHGDPGLLPAVAMQQPRGQYHLGTVRIEIREEPLPNGGPDGVAYQASAMTTVADDPNAFAPKNLRVMEAHIDINPLINSSTGGGYAQVPVFDRETGSAAGTVVVALQVHVGTAGGVGPKAASPVHPARGGLVSLVGLDSLVEGTGCSPCLDFDSDFPAAARGADDSTPEGQAALAGWRRMAMMGDFVNHAYLQHHVQQYRSVDSNNLVEKHRAYKGALDSALTNSAASFQEPSCKRKDPRPFRPSSSRVDAPLAGIPFNVHIQTFSLVALGGTGCAEKVVNGRPVALYHNVTHGAPSDHARGFSGPVNPLAAVPGARGGLRRLEAARLTASQKVLETQNKLVQAVAAHFGAQAQHKLPQSGRGKTSHIPTSHSEIGLLRTASCEAVQALHALTWDIAVRRASVFSQALGIAVTSYLSHVSDAAKIGPAVGGGWPEVWKKHGFLITFEGLLSAVGKELGMIEDASVGIAMLRMVSVAFAPDSGASSSPQQQGVNISVPHSPYVRWINLSPSGIGSSTRYSLQIGLDQGYFNQRVPATLRDGTAVRFYPVLFQMGVDIRQWGANAGTSAVTSAKNQVAERQQQITNWNSTEGLTDEGNAGSNGGLFDDDDDDDAGFADNDALVALNIEAFGKMNAYSHTITPTGNISLPLLTWENAQHQQQQQTPIHPTVAKLNEYIRSSAGKMEHGVLDEAASIAAKLGGGAAIFCKSGKDRTAMQVTFKQAQFLNKYLEGGLTQDVLLSQSKIFADATMMRIYGTRLPICEKNVGQAMYAFNSLQRKFMPEMLKPPLSTLAGFLKGGKVFSREGGIES